MLRASISDVDVALGDTDATAATGISPSVSSALLRPPPPSSSCLYCPYRRPIDDFYFSLTSLFAALYARLHPHPHALVVVVYDESHTDRLPHFSWRGRRIGGYILQALIRRTSLLFLLVSSLFFFFVGFSQGCLFFSGGPACFSLCFVPRLLPYRIYLSLCVVDKQSDRPLSLSYIYTYTYIQRERHICICLYHIDYL